MEQKTENKLTKLLKFIADNTDIELTDKSQQIMKGLGVKLNQYMMLVESAIKLLVQYHKKYVEIVDLES